MHAGSLGGLRHVGVVLERVVEHEAADLRVAGVARGLGLGGRWRG